MQFSLSLSLKGWCKAPVHEEELGEQVKKRGNRGRSTVADPTASFSASPFALGWGHGTSSVQWAKYK